MEESISDLDVVVGIDDGGGETRGKWLETVCAATDECSGSSSMTENQFEELIELWKAAPYLFAGVNVQSRLQDAEEAHNNRSFGRQKGTPRVSSNPFVAAKTSAVDGWKRGANADWYLIAAPFFAVAGLFEGATKSIVQ